MIKKLKSIEKIKSEFKCTCSFGDIKTHVDIYKCSPLINSEMFELFGNTIDVVNIDQYGENIYNFEILYHYESLETGWHFHKDWFESDINILEDSLFEVL